MAEVQLLCLSFVLCLSAIAQAVNQTSTVQLETTTVPVETKINTITVVNETKPAVAVDPPHVAAAQEKGSFRLEKTLELFKPDNLKQVLGSRCGGDKDCLSIKNSNCADGVCVCIKGFIPSKHSLDKCMKVPSGLGDSCEEEAQCEHAVPDSECKASVCSCPPNYIYFDGRCWQKQVLGGVCNNSLQCDDITFSTCDQGVCACEPPLIPSPINKCLEPAGDQYLFRCVEDIQCTHSYGDESRCSNGLCRCTSDYHYNGTKCIPDLKLGEPCSVDTDCTVSDSNNVDDARMCIGNTCACAAGYQLLAGEEICTKSSGEELAVSLTWVLCIIVAKFYLS